MKVLIVDDDTKIITILKAYLEKHGYEVLQAEDGISGLAMALDKKPDIVLLDVMMPGMDGFEVCRNIRNISAVPIIMLTASDGEEARLQGFDYGVDDYIVKPFSPREVVARVDAVLRRVKMTKRDEQSESKEKNVLSVGDLVLNMETRDVTLNGQVLAVTPTEFSILVLFMKEPGRAFSRNQILGAVQDIAYEGYDRSIDSHVKNLRKKLNADSESPFNIKTVYGIGYKMVGE